MRPEGKKSPAADPGNVKKLSVLMKPRIKQREKDQPGKISRKSLELLSPEYGYKNKKGTTTNRLTRQSATSHLQELPRKTCTWPLAKPSTSSRRTQQESENVFTTNKRLTTPRTTPITPKIMISKCSKLEKLAESTEQEKIKTVPRKKVKSPAVSKVVKSGTKDIKENGKVGKERMLEYETKLRKNESEIKKKNAEILLLNRKLSSVQKTVIEKEKVIKNLELKFPKMLSELKKGLNEERKTNVGLKETLRKNKQLSGVNKKTEDLLKIKDEKLKEVMNCKNNLIEDLKAKELELNEFRERLSTLENKLPGFISRIKSKEEDLDKCRDTIEFLEQRLVFQSEENNNKEDEIVDLKNQVKDLSDELLDKDKELVDVRANNNEMYKQLMEQYSKLEATDFETKNYLDIIDNIRGKLDARPTDVNVLHESIDCLDKATEDFLDKVSAVSREKNMSFNVKLTVRKNLGGSFRDNSPENFGSYLLRPVSFDNNNSSRVNFNSIRHSSFRSSGSRLSKGDVGFQEYQSFVPNTYDEVFDEYNMKCGSRNSIVDSSLATTDASRDDIDVSSDTCTRFDNLDNKVRSLWTKLSTRDETFEEFKSDKKEKFSNSVNKLKDELSESIQHHNKFLTQVSVAKKLFSSPKQA